MKQIIERVYLYYIIIFFFLFSFFGNIYFTTEQQYVYLAQAFLHGQLHFSQLPGTWDDVVFFQGRYYWHMGPFPAILLIPFILLFNSFSLFFYQGYLQFFLTLGIFLLCFVIARKSSYSCRDSLFLAFGFCFASVYQFIAVVSWVWYFAQAVCVFFLFLAISEYLTRRRYFLIGVFLGFVFATRFTAGLGITFFIFSVLMSRSMHWEKKVKQLAFLCLPVVFMLGMLVFYNYARFGNPFENGFLLSNNSFLSVTDRYEQLHYGLFKLRNIPTNVYYYFIKGLDPVVVQQKTLWGNTYVLQSPYVTVRYPGTSFFIVSPLFFYLFKARFKERIVKLCLVPIIVILSFLLTYYWTGWRQVGPRYFLDFLPFAYIVLLHSFKRFRLSGFAKGVIIVSAFFDLYLLTQVAAMINP